MIRFSLGWTDPFSLDLDELDRGNALVAGLGYDSLPGIGGQDAWKAGSLSLSLKADFPFIVRWLRPNLSVGEGFFLDYASSVRFGGSRPPWD